MHPAGPTPAALALVACPGLDDYERLVAALAAGHLPPGAVPVLASRAGVTVRGFPPGTTVVDAAALPAGGSRSPAATGPAAGGGPAGASPVALVVADRACLAVARLLSVTSGKAVQPVDGEEALGEALDGALQPEPGTPASITLVLPGWDEDGRPSARWLRRALLALRARRERAARVPLGLVVAARPADLSMLAARAVLQPGIVAAYRSAPACLFSTFHDPTLPAAPLARWAPGAPRAPLMLVDDRHVEDGSALEALARPWSLLVLKSHGRPYCASRGHVCGARPLEADAETEPDGCVLGMACASAAYPQLDPRRLDAPVVVMDACGAGSWATPVWDEGIPSVAFHAVAGTAGAVITGDRVTMNRSGDFADVFWALASAATIGQAVARLNWVRRAPGRPPLLDYFLIGDPDQPAGTARWPDWVSPADRPPAAAGATPYVRVRLPERDPPVRPEVEAVHVWSEEGPVTVDGGRAFAAWADAEVWLAGGAGPGVGAAAVQAAARPVPRLPSGLGAEALRFAAASRTWTAELAAPRERLLAAADRLITMDRVLQQAPGILVRARPGDLAAAAGVAVAEWRRAHVAAVEHALGSADRGLWPYRFWSMADVVTDELDDPCPYCATVPTLRREYRSHPGLAREQWECQRCDLIHDRPAGPGAAITLEVPERLPAGAAVAARVVVEAVAGGPDLHGAVVVTVDGSGHGVACSPGAVEFEVPAGERREHRATLTVPDRPERPHLWRARGLALVNGSWLLASRQVRVGVA